MKLLLDEGLPLTAATLLTEAGINTVHVGQIGLAGAEDSQILAAAVSQERVVVTLDADFHTLLALNKVKTPSVIRIRLQGLRALPLRDLLLTVLDECRKDLEEGAVVTVDHNRIRLRHLPLLRDKE